MRLTIWYVAIGVGAAVCGSIVNLAVGPAPFWALHVADFLGIDRAHARLYWLDVPPAAGALLFGAIAGLVVPRRAATGLFLLAVSAYGLSDLFFLALLGRTSQARQGLWHGFAALAATILIGCIGAKIVLAARQRRLPSEPGHCVTCGYDLTGNVSGRCPECGTDM